MLFWLQKLHYWQDLVGAVIGGLLGVFGALIVAWSVEARERRRAVRMLRRDLSNVVDVVNALTYDRKLTLQEVGADTLVQRISLYTPPLSALFESQAGIVVELDRSLGTLLLDFQKHYALVNNFMYAIGRANLPSQVARERDLLPGLLEAADDEARACLYFLRLQEMGRFRRAMVRCRRWLKPTKADRELEELLGRIRERNADSVVE